MFKDVSRLSRLNSFPAILVSVVMAFSLNELAIAQEDAAFEEIVVTARKREESLLEVPLSITALTSDDIEQKGIGEFKDIISFTPGFHFAEHSVGRADRSNRILVIRGMHISQENDHQQAAKLYEKELTQLIQDLSMEECSPAISRVTGKNFEQFYLVLEHLLKVLVFFSFLKVHLIQLLLFHEG